MAAVALKISGPEGERRVSVNGSVRIGRSAASDVVLKHPAVSADALVVRRDGSGAIAEPIGGVIALNDARMQSKRQLKDGDEIKLGPYRILVTVTGSLSVRPPSVRPGTLTPVASRPSAPPGTLPPGIKTPTLRPSAPPPEAVEISEGERLQALAEARTRLIGGEKRSIVLSKLVEAGIARGEATANIEGVISELRAATRRRAIRRVLLGLLTLLLGLLVTAYYARFIPTIGAKVLELRLPHTERVFLFAGEYWLGPVLALLGASLLLAGVFRVVRGDSRYKGR